MLQSLKTAEEKISALRDEYTQSLSSRFADLNQAYTDILESKVNEQAIQNLEALSHTLCGSAGTFGFGEIATCCKRIEGCCRVLKNEQHNSVVLNEISKLLSQLDDAILSPTLSEQAVDLEFATTIKYELTNNLIYFLDKDEVFLKDLKTKIEKYGFIVKYFLQLEDFREALEAELPEALIVGITEESDDWLKAINLANECVDAHIASIVISSEHDFETRLKCVRARADAFLTKPADTSDIIEVLEGLIRNRYKDPFRILIVDDAEVMSDYYRIVLERAGMVCHSTTQPRDIMRVLSSFEPELVLMDLHMPDCRGDELAKLIHQENTYISLPIIYLSSENNVSKQLSALQMGGDDFFTKPIRPSQLVSAVAIRVRRYRQINRFINKDGLTGLLNHSCLKAMLDKECTRSSRNNQEFCFAMLDLDRFKNINDEFGHTVGDEILKSLAWLLKQRLRKTDIVGRYGGEEFGIILPDTSINAAEMILNELLEVFRNLEVKVKEHTVKASFSAGIASYAEYKTSDELCQAADKFLYDAKFAGRNQVCATKVSPDVV